MVEYHFDERNNGLITIDDSTVKQTLNIYRCHNTVVKVSSKINAILIDDCSRVSVVCDDVVSSIDVVNCQVRPRPPSLHLRSNAQFLFLGRVACQPVPSCSTRTGRKEGRTSVLFVAHLPSAPPPIATC